MANDPFDIDALRAPPDLVALQKKVEPPATPTRKAKQAGRFVMLPFEALPIFNALTGPQALVWVRLHYLAWFNKSRTVLLPNSALTDWGVTRKQKYAALRKLEQLGVVTVERRTRKSPRITLP
jgi:hypothetical protein